MQEFIRLIRSIDSLWIAVSSLLFFSAACTKFYLDYLKINELKKKEQKEKEEEEEKNRRIIKPSLADIQNYSSNRNVRKYGTIIVLSITASISIAYNYSSYVTTHRLKVNYQNEVLKSARISEVNDSLVRSFTHQIELHQFQINELIEAMESPFTSVNDSISGSERSKFKNTVDSLKNELYQENITKRAIRDSLAAITKYNNFLNKKINRLNGDTARLAFIVQNNAIKVKRLQDSLRHFRQQNRFGYIHVDSIDVVYLYYLHTEYSKFNISTELGNDYWKDAPKGRIEDLAVEHIKISTGGGNFRKVSVKYFQYLGGLEYSVVYKDSGYSVRINYNLVRGETTNYQFKPKKR